MGFDAAGLASFVTDQLRAVADPDNAEPMAAYMKTEMPFLGVRSKARRSVMKEAERRYPIESDEDYVAAVETLWRLPHREEKYVAVDLAIEAQAHIHYRHVPLYRRLIVEGAWWDFVDNIASNLIGRVLLRDRDRMSSLLERWIDDDDMWIRRTALLARLKHKDETDVAQLFRFCLARAHESEFFIRKAIGWALREYAKTDPSAVRSFVLDNRSALSGLSFREATKHLDV